MIFSTATANLYFYPFEQALEIIAEAGFHNIELDLYWERKDWAMDTTHYAEIGVDIVDASRVLGSSLNTIHLSDYAPAQRHAMIGEGILDFSRFFSGVDRESLSAVTLECSFSSPIKQDREMNRAELVNRMKEARLRMEQYL